MFFKYLFSTFELIFMKEYWNFGKNKEVIVFSPLFIKISIEDLSTNIFIGSVVPFETYGQRIGLENKLLKLTIPDLPLSKINSPVLC